MKTCLLFKMLTLAALAALQTKCNGEYSLDDVWDCNLSPLGIGIKKGGLCGHLFLTSQHEDRSKSSRYNPGRGI